MSKKRVLALVSLISYGNFVAMGGVCAAFIQNKAFGDNFSLDGIADALGAVALAAVMIIGALYAALGFIPCALKIVDIILDSKIPSIICILFDIAFMYINGQAFLASLGAISFDGAIVIILILLIPLLVSIASFLANIFKIKEHLK